MAEMINKALETFAVLKPDLNINTVKVEPGLYENLDKDFNNFKGHILVSTYEFSQSWPSWERHPAGDEIVMLLEGKATMIMEKATGNEQVNLEEAGSYIIIPKGVWHTAKVLEKTKMLFITPGEGTENRYL